MKKFHEYMDVYRKQMEQGDIREAYKGLMEYLMKLKTDFKKKYPKFDVSGSLYYGYMDMSYFAVIPESLKLKKLKIAVVFCHDTCRFEVWLAGYNKQIQSQYWNMFKENANKESMENENPEKVNLKNKNTKSENIQNHRWNSYRIPPSLEGIDSIIECIIDEHPDFRDLDALTDQIEQTTLKFIKDVEDFLTKQIH